MVGNLLGNSGENAANLHIEDAHNLGTLLQVYTSALGGDFYRDLQEW